MNLPHTFARLLGRAATHCAVACALASGFLALAATNAAAQPTVKVASDPSFKPFAFMNTDTGRMEGFDIDILQAAATIAGYRAEIVPIDFAGIIPALQSGNVEAGASSITITEARKAVIAFTQPYYDSGLQLLVRHNETAVDGIAALKGKTVAALTGSTGYQYAAQQLGSSATLVPYPSYAAAFLALQAGSAQAVIGDQPVLAYYGSTAGKGKAKVVGPLYSGEQFGFAFRKNSPWLEPTNRALEAMRSNGSYATIYRKWFGTEAPATSNAASKAAPKAAP